MIYVKTNQKPKNPGLYPVIYSDGSHGWELWTGRWFEVEYSHPVTHWKQPVSEVVSEWCLRFGLCDKHYPVSPPPNGCQAIEYHRNLKA